MSGYSRGAIKWISMNADVAKNIIQGFNYLNQYFCQ